VPPARASTAPVRAAPALRPRRPRICYVAAVQPPELRLRKDVTRALRLGHPWVYRDALVAPARGLGAGAVVALHGTGAQGYYDPDGPIAVRVLATDGVMLDADLLAARVRAAARLRAAIAPRLDSDGLRLIHGEGDRLPGLVVDRYAEVGVARFDGDAARAFYGPHLDGIGAELAEVGFPLDALHLRAGRRGAAASAETRGTLPAELTFREGRAHYEVDVRHGQKTGFFLDQRENRALVAGLAAGATVLNLFGYTGGFSVAAGLAGARAVTTVDLAGPAIDAARRNLARNGLGAGHELVVADCRAFLAEAAAAGRRWDIVVCDPPSFAPSARVLPAALAAYRELNRAAAAVVADGGLLATASCSSHVTPAAFQAVVAEALAPRAARVLAQRGAGPDHPVLPAFPEGRYLKFLLVAR
jgi:23S rRNA (cytosine1962-C5)-methyltransferase